MMVILLFVSILSFSHAWDYTIALPFTHHETLYYSMNNETQLSNGKGTSLVVGTAGLNGARRGLIAFDLTKLSTIKDLRSATPLKAYLTMAVKNSWPGDMKIEVFSVNSAWGEGNSDAGFYPLQGTRAQTGDATWLYRYYPTELWSVPGGDYNPQPLGEQTISGFHTFHWESFQMADLLFAIANGTRTSTGFLLKSLDENATFTCAREFFACNCVDGASTIPQLVLIVSAAAPTWLWLVIVGGSICVIATVSFLLLHYRSYFTSHDYTINYGRLSDFDIDVKSDLYSIFNDPAIRLIPFNDFKSGKVIGTGATGAVYAGTLKSGHQVALKKIPVNQDSEDDLNAFVDEIRIMTTIAHPYLLSLTGVSITDTGEHVILITELMSRGSLTNVMAKEKLTLAQKMRIIKQISFGMHYLHSIRPRIIHRDLKPDNILMSDDDCIKIADFGMSRWIQNQSNVMTRSGTPHYMAPETITMGKFSEKSDVYSFGIIVWELYCEKRPYLNVGNPYQIMFKVVNEELRPEIPAHCPLALSRLISRCIMLNTQDRPTFKEIIGLLQSADLNPETMLLGGTTSGEELTRRDTSSKVSSEEQQQDSDSPTISANFLAPTSSSQSMTISKEKKHLVNFDSSTRIINSTTKDNYYTIQ